MPKAPKTMTVLTVRLPKELVDQLTKVGKKRIVPRSTLIRMALSDWLAEHAKTRGPLA